MGLAELASAAVIALVGLAVIMSADWSIQRATGDTGWIDAIWTFGVGVMGVVLAIALFGGEGLLRRVIVAALTAAWSMRLGLHIVRRTLKWTHNADRRGNVLNQLKPARGVEFGGRFTIRSPKQ